jgi:hypothetical protein
VGGDISWTTNDALDLPDEFLSSELRLMIEEVWKERSSFLRMSLSQ